LRRNAKRQPKRGKTGQQSETEVWRLVAVQVEENADRDATLRKEVTNETLIAREKIKVECDDFVHAFP
jgi:hypothetical protein